MSKFAVAIKYHEDDEVEHIVGKEGMTKHRAEHVEDGVNINLDHERFYTEVIEVNDE